MENKNKENNQEGFRVHFTQSKTEQIRLSDSKQLQSLKQKTQHDLNGLEKEKAQVSGQQSWDQQTVKQKLDKFIKFVHFHSVLQSEVWKKRKELSITEFANLINENYGYYLTNAELAALMKLSTRKNLLRAKDFEPLGLWLTQKTPMSLTRYTSSKVVPTYNKNKAQNLTRIQKTTDQSGWINDQTSPHFQKAQGKLFESTIKSSKSTKEFNKENFKQAQKYSQAKVKIKVEELKKDIKKSVLQKKWDFIVMAGQMNQWIEQLTKQSQDGSSQTHQQPSLSYRFKVLNKDPVQLIQQNIDTHIEESIPHVVFIKKYQTLKKRMVKEENNKNNLKGTVLMVLEDNDKFSKNNLINRINQRDQELNFVLLQIMRMKSMFQWQNNILKEAKINS